MSSVNLTINNKSVSVPKGSTILEAAKKIKYKNTYSLPSSYG